MSVLERCDDNHVGHFFYNYIQKQPDEICQIDAATGQQETRRSTLSRTIRLARSFRKLGLQPGDVMALGGRNHLDIHIPFYAALLNGLPMAGVDPLFKYGEIKLFFKIVEPKIAFCEFTMYEDYQRVVQDLGLDTKIVTFGGGECSMDKFMEAYHDPRPEEKFEVATFDTEKVSCWLLSTSGTSGTPKVVAMKHWNILQHLSFFLFDKTNVGERRTALQLSSLQWLSATYNTLLMPVHHIKLQTSAPATADHVIDIINKYKPAVTITTPTMLASILHHHKHCNLTCFKIIKTGGAKVHAELLNELKPRLHKDAVIVQGYGQTENGGIVLESAPDGPFGNIGKPRPEYQLRVSLRWFLARSDENLLSHLKMAQSALFKVSPSLQIVDPSSGKTIEEPNVPGELWTKGPRMACYYNNPKATAEAFSEDGYYKTGDLVYKDENDYYFFVERLKMLLKYRNYQVVPPEVEEVILTHPGVEDVCVTGVPHLDDGERVVACVVRRAGATVTAQEIKDLVASQLSAPKQLHGGVLFLNELPLTSSGKIARFKVKELVLTATRE